MTDQVHRVRVPAPIAWPNSLCPSCGGPIAAASERPFTFADYIRALLDGLQMPSRDARAKAAALVMRLRDDGNELSLTTMERDALINAADHASFCSRLAVLVVPFDEALTRAERVVTDPVQIAPEGIVAHVHEEQNHGTESDGTPGSELEPAGARRSGSGAADE